MRALGCKTIRDGMTTAGIFFITGFCLMSAGFLVIPDLWYLPHIIITAGILILLMVPVILIATYLKHHH